jgi:hypothetical protein
VLGLHGCAGTAAPRGRPVAPGELFAGGYISIKAPSSAGWLLMQSSGSGMLFGKGGQAPRETFIAHAGMFELSPTQTPDEFEALIKVAIDKDTDTTRFAVQQASIKYSSERNYPCVRYQSVAQDKRPAAGGPLVLELDGLYCRHPVRQETGFSAVYSHRGPTRHANLRGEAEDFIQGVQVPDK